MRAWGHALLAILGLFVILGQPIVMVAYGIYGKRIAWQSRQWRDFDDFLACQRKWTTWAVWLSILSAIGFLIIVSNLSSIMHSASNSTTVGANVGVSPNVSVRPSAPTRSVTNRRIFGASGSGIHTTEKFVVNQDWDLSWHYDCSNFGTAGNFAVVVYTEGDQLPAVVVNELGTSGQNVEHLHRGGRVYLAVNSLCRWQVSAWQH
jgi:hypothetical protein